LRLDLSYMGWKNHALTVVIAFPASKALLL
jgi:hypothetical protein